MPPPAEASLPSQKNCPKKNPLPRHAPAAGTANLCPACCVPLSTHQQTAPVLLYYRNMGIGYDLQQRRGIRRYIFRPYRRKTFLSDICKQSDVAAHSVSDEFPRYCRLRYLASLPAAPGSEQTAGKAGNGKSLLAFRYPPMRFLRLFHPHQKKPAAGAISAAAADIIFIYAESALFGEDR